MVLIGSNLNRLTLFREAVKMGEDLIIKANAHNRPEFEATGRTIIAVAYAEVGNYDQSSKLYFENLTYYENINDKESMGFTLGNIGADFLSQKNYDKAFTYIKQSLDIALKINNLILATDQYNNMAIVYQFGYNDLESALKYFHKANEIAVTINDSLQQGRTNLNIGQVYINLKASDSVRKYIHRSIEIFKKLNSPPFIANTYILYAELAKEYKQSDSTIYWATKAFEIAEKHNLLMIIDQASRILYEEYLNTQDTLNAFKYLKLKSELADSLNQLQSEKSLFKLELLYNQEKAAKARQVKQQLTYILIGVFLLILLALILIIWLNYSRQKVIAKNALLEKVQIEKDLKYKRKELSMNLIILINKNKMLTYILKKLNELEKISKLQDFRKYASDLKNEIKQKNDTRLWEEFSVRLNETNNVFYEKLLKEFPDLTQNELKLCAYLRLNMSTKEIAQLTGQRPQTIDHARYRLRKKLGLSNSDVNLVHYLAQI
ncbi:MAG: tetratricopeptide repeat protein [Bacteroidales bacterium]